MPGWVKVPTIDTKTVTLVSIEINYGSSLTKKNKRAKVTGNEMIIVTINVCKLLFRSKRRDAFKTPNIRCSTIISQIFRNSSLTGGVMTFNIKQRQGQKYYPRSVSHI